MNCVILYDVLLILPQSLINALPPIITKYFSVIRFGYFWNSFIPKFYLILYKLNVFCLNKIISCFGYKTRISTRTRAIRIIYLNSLLGHLLVLTPVLSTSKHSSNHCLHHALKLNLMYNMAKDPISTLKDLKS